jgi:hypothetical protein
MTLGGQNKDRVRPELPNRTQVTRDPRYQTEFFLRPITEVVAAVRNVEERGETLTRERVERELEKTKQK